MGGGDACRGGRRGWKTKRHAVVSACSVGGLEGQKANERLINI